MTTGQILVGRGDILKRLSATTALDEELNVRLEPASPPPDDRFVASDASNLERLRLFAEVKTVEPLACALDVNVVGCLRTTNKVARIGAAAVAHNEFVGGAREATLEMN